ncbi:MAG: DUF5658 family protein [Firmicutes bacterium]|nr:DUF5658 family protein [Bacillota bacterium]
MPGQFRTLWRQFWVIAVLQVADLHTTYLVLEKGGREGNVFMKSLILTPLAPVVKALALAFFAALIVGSHRYGHPSPRRLAIAAWVVLGIYLVTIINNLAIVLSP